MSPLEKATPLTKARDADVHPSTPHLDDVGLQNLGSNTADSIGDPSANKPVRLEVRIPKSLRKAIRAEAKRRRITVDELVAEALRDRNR